VKKTYRQESEGYAAKPKDTAEAVRMKINTDKP
jgi:hypothetical protein